MSKEFEEAKLVITADIAFDPDEECMNSFHNDLMHDIIGLLNNYYLLHKNTKVTLESFICEHK